MPEPEGLKKELLETCEKEEEQIIFLVLFGNPMKVWLFFINPSTIYISMILKLLNLWKKKKGRSHAVKYVVY